MPSGRPAASGSNGRVGVCSRARWERPAVRANRHAVSRCRCLARIARPGCPGSGRRAGWGSTVYRPLPARVQLRGNAAWETGTSRSRSRKSRSATTALAWVGLSSSSEQRARDPSAGRLISVPPDRSHSLPHLFRPITVLLLVRACIRHHRGLYDEHATPSLTPVHHSTCSACCICVRRVAGRVTRAVAFASIAFRCSEPLPRDRSTKEERRWPSTALASSQLIIDVQVALHKTASDRPDRQLRKYSSHLICRARPGRIASIVCLIDHLTDTLLCFDTTGLV